MHKSLSRDSSLYLITEIMFQSCFIFLCSVIGLLRSEVISPFERMLVIFKQLSVKPSKVKCYTAWCKRVCKIHANTPSFVLSDSRMYLHWKSDVFYVCRKCIWPKKCQLMEAWSTDGWYVQKEAKNSVVTVAVFSVSHYYYRCLFIWRKHCYVYLNFYVCLICDALNILWQRKIWSIVWILTQLWIQTKSVMCLCFCVHFSSKEGVWSNNGCLRAGGNLSYSICVCNHLTNFAILMQVVPVEVRIIVLGVLKFKQVAPGSTVEPDVMAGC